MNKLHEAFPKNRAERIVFWLTMVLLLLFSVVTGLAHATVPMVTVTVSPQTGVGSATPTVTWSAPGAASCTASGGWTGVKAASGSVTLPALATIGVTTFNLTCTSLTGKVTLNWTPPTQNTDGSTLTNLSGYKVLYGPTSSNMPTTVSLSGAGLSTALLDGVPSGPQFFVLRAVNSAQAESASTNFVSATIAPDTGSGSGTLTITAPPVPKAPTNFTATP